VSGRAGGGGLVPGGAAALAGCICLGAASLVLEFRDKSAGGLPWASVGLIAAAFICFGLAAVQARRAKPAGGPAPRASGATARPVTRRGLQPALVVFHIGLLASASLAAYGGYLLHQRNTGPHVAVTVTRCELVDPGPSSAGPHDYCYGTWSYQGRSYDGGYVQGAGFEDEGHLIDATLHGETAYSRDLQTPLILLGVFGIASLLLIGLCISTWRRWSRAPRT